MSSAQKGSTDKSATESDFELGKLHAVIDTAKAALERRDPRAEYYVSEDDLKKVLLGGGRSDIVTKYNLCGGETNDFQSTYDCVYPDSPYHDDEDSQWAVHFARACARASKSRKIAEGYIPDSLYYEPTKQQLIWKRPMNTEGRLSDIEAENAILKYLGSLPDADENMNCNIGFPDRFAIRYCEYAPEEEEYIYRISSVDVTTTPHIVVPQEHTTDKEEVNVAYNRPISQAATRAINAHTDTDFSNFKVDANVDSIYKVYPEISRRLFRGAQAVGRALSAGTISLIDPAEGQSTFPATKSTVAMDNTADGITFHIKTDQGTTFDLNHSWLSLSEAAEEGKEEYSYSQGEFAKEDHELGLEKVKNAKL
ncbi:hypothetical protein I203_106005 [Kwoniella mangroviensis CBS 8507]|uniref:uncharacterized protein n=1 Tax=Kwoniella mangroviensis CBS 8507 TaxID=1296122 RepID=UPI00080CE66A|nr:uncharacterized protein I203_04483 [Kwoniella mangroviensis CBS 8507]OCF66157.1 hypothetical protein I203_04483 [Kwoniella mangroviensis CBS 8507]